jgi:hypothetical protein
MTIKNKLMIISNYSYFCLLYNVEICVCRWAGNRSPPGNGMGPPSLAVFHLSYYSISVYFFVFANSVLRTRVTLYSHSIPIDSSIAICSSGSPIS